MKSISKILESKHLQRGFWFLVRGIIFTIIWWEFARVISWTLFHYVWDKASIGWWVSFLFISPVLLLSWLVAELLLHKNGAPQKALWIYSTINLLVWIMIALIWVIIGNYEDIYYKILS